MESSIVQSFDNDLNNNDNVSYCPSLSKKSFQTQGSLSKSKKIKKATRKGGGVPPGKFDKKRLLSQLNFKKLTNKAYRNIKQYFGRALLNFIKFKKKQLVLRSKESNNNEYEQVNNNNMILSITPLLMWLNDLNYKNQMKTT